uniref:BACK domain-containing protein n=1 Tax=Anopheles farauti TaxID=69004 RepID=A0A182Q225_9DIPT
MVQPFNTDEANGARPMAGPPIPTAPPMDSGEGTDSQHVNFLVLGNKENYDVRADRKAILDSNTGLAQMLSGGDGGKCVVRDVNPVTFECFVRYLETKYIKFPSTSHMLEMLVLAVRFQCPQLEIHCVKELDLSLDVSNVLDVYRALWFYNSITPAKVPPSQPKRRSRCPRAHKSSSGQTSIGPVTPEEHFAALLTNCLQLIDMQTEQVFAQEAMLSLRFPELEMIVRRDALQMSSEAVLIDLLARWSLEDCKRKHIDPTAENRRRALGALCYTPRYLTMARREFDAARERIEMLDPAELQLVGDALGGLSRAANANLTPEQQALVARFRAPRPDFPQLPVHLSTRSHPRNYPKRMRKAAAEAERALREGPKKSCCNRFLLNCCSVFACIFD